MNSEPRFKNVTQKDAYFLAGTSLYLQKNEDKRDEVKGSIKVFADNSMELSTLFTKVLADELKYLEDIYQSILEEFKTAKDDIDLEMISESYQKRIDFLRELKEPQDIRNVNLILNI